MTADKALVEARREALAASHPEWVPVSIDARLAECVEQYGERPFVITDDRTLTYAETQAWARRIADGLVARGLQRGEHVGILVANFVEFVPIKFAVAMAGGVAIPMNFLYRTDELAYVLEQAQVRFLFTMDSFMHLEYLTMLDEIVPGWDGSQARGGELPLLRQIVQVPVVGTPRGGVLSLDDLTAEGDESEGGSAGRGLDPHDLSDILYTSGSTGAPKGVMVTSDAVLRTGFASAMTRAYEDGRRVLFALPCYHMFGLVEGLLSVINVGGAIVLQPRFSAEGYLKGIEDHRANDILCVPTMTIQVIEQMAVGEYDVSSLQALLSGSAPGPAWLWDKAQEVLGVDEIVTGYGMTECGGAMTLTLPEDQHEITATTVGRPKLAGSAGIADLPGNPICEYRTADIVTGELLPDGEEGEIVSRGPTHMLGYWDKPEESAEALRNGWLYSGDLGRVLPSGYIQLTGRSKEVYKSGGELVMPKEVEETVAQLDGVSQVFSIGIPDERWGEIGCLFVVRTPGSTIDEAAIIDHCRANLARFKVPKKVIFEDIENLPKTPTGKIQKFRLVELATEKIQ